MWQIKAKNENYILKTVESNERVCSARVAAPNILNSKDDIKILIFITEKFLSNLKSNNLVCQQKKIFNFIMTM